MEYRTDSAQANWMRQALAKDEKQFHDGSYGLSSLILAEECAARTKCADEPELADLAAEIIEEFESAR